MKLQFAILVFMACLNLGIGLTVALGLPGTEFLTPNMPSNPAMNSTSYEQYFNATEQAEQWRSNPVSGIPIVGDIYSAFNFFTRNWQWLIDGFPTLLTWISDNLITDPSAKTAFWIIANALRAIYAVLMSVFVIEFIGGRILSK